MEQASMSEKTGIAWCDHTFNPWWGCTKVGPGCDGCYAEVWANRFGTKWGDDQPRRYFGEKHWNDPIKWNRKAEAASVRRRVFCASMADVFDKHADPAVRARLFRLIKETPWLDWLLLTKRIVNAPKMLPEDWGDGYPNVWLLATVVTQEEYDRDKDRLLSVPAAVHGLSIEPQVSHIRADDMSNGERRIKWVIVGGESTQGAHRARPFDLEWARDLKGDCRSNGAAFFMKQVGSAAWMRDKAGADPSEWPEDIRVREFPA
jgi:protein gp37